MFLLGFVLSALIVIVCAMLIIYVCTGSFSFLRSGDDAIDEYLSNHSDYVKTKENISSMTDQKHKKNML